MAKFYRVCNPLTKQGLWYSFQGEKTGLIHQEFSFCTNRELPMPFDAELIDWLSATQDIESLYQWFTLDDILKLQKCGWYVYEYEVSNYKFYNKHQHYVICKNTSVPICRLIFREDGTQIKYLLKQ